MNDVADFFDEHSKAPDAQASVGRAVDQAYRVLLKVPRMLYPLRTVLIEATKT